MATERIIGIDFGTSTTVVRVKTYIDGQPECSAVFAEPVKFDAQDTLPTLLYWDSAYEEYLVGYEAENMFDSGQGELFHNIKLELRSADPAARTRAEELTARFFGYIYSVYADQWEHFMPCDTETTYVSYPAAWPRELADAMVRIAEAAGFKNVHGLDEPSAAIRTVLVQKESDLQMRGEMYVLMVDMGAGTTDLALCRYSCGKNAEIISTWPRAGQDALFGGREIDEALWEYVKAYLADCGISGIEDERTYLPKSKAWKEANVSRLLKKDRPVTTCGFCHPLLAYLCSQPKPFPALDRAVFEQLLESYLRGFPALVNGLLENTPGVAPEDIDLVILTGGHSQWYFADEILSGQLTRFGAVNLPKIQQDPEGRIIRLSRPQETVALGLVYQGIEMPEPEVEPEPQLEVGEDESEWELEHYKDGLFFYKKGDMNKYCVMNVLWAGKIWYAQRYGDFAYAVIKPVDSTKYTISRFNLKIRENGGMERSEPLIIVDYFIHWVKATRTGIYYAGSHKVMKMDFEGRNRRILNDAGSRENGYDSISRCDDQYLYFSTFGIKNGLFTGSSIIAGDERKYRLNLDTDKVEQI